MAAKQRRLILIIGVLIGLTAVLSIGSLFLNRSDLGPTLNKLRASQDEVLRINDLASKLSPNLALSQFQANVSALTATDIALIESERAKASGDSRLPKEFTTAATLAEAEDELRSGAQRNNLTKSYVEIMTAELEKQQGLVKTALGQTKRDETKRILTLVDEHLSSLLEQIDKLSTQ